MGSEEEGKNAASRDDKSGIDSKPEGVHLRVSGMQDEDVFTRDSVYTEAMSVVKKIMKMIQVSDFALNVKKYHEAGSRHKFSIRIRLVSGSDIFQADDYEWDIHKAVKKTLEKLEREVHRREAKKTVYTRAP